MKDNVTNDKQDIWLNLPVLAMNSTGSHRWNLIGYQIECHYSSLMPQSRCPVVWQVRSVFGRSPGLWMVSAGSRRDCELSPPRPDPRRGDAKKQEELYGTSYWHHWIVINLTTICLVHIATTGTSNCTHLKSTIHDLVYHLECFVFGMIEWIGRQLVLVLSTVER